jgi:hypothetical protein
VHRAIGFFAEAIASWSFLVPGTPHFLLTRGGQLTLIILDALFDAPPTGSNASAELLDFGSAIRRDAGMLRRPFRDCRGRRLSGRLSRIGDPC